MIISVHNQDPGTPLDEQRPGIARYQVGPHWVDATGAAPTLADVDAYLNPPLTKAQQIAAILATQGKGRDRTTIQLSIQVAELIATIQAPAYGMTVPQAIAYAYSKNTTYRESKDAEAAIRAVELAP